ncbi:MAG: hypothetical protein KC583_21210 [Myxococcales bacterium]|nr:hypothetical protein [Myxococcales bacterium]
MKSLAQPMAAIALLLAATPAGAITTAGFDHARPLAPQQAEAGAALTAGADAWFIGAHGRIGLLPELDAGLRAGLVLLDDQSGFEVEGGARFRFLRTEDTGGAVDLAFATFGAVLKSDAAFLGSVDPQLLVSRHFDIGDGRAVYVAGGFGLAVTFLDQDGRDSDSELGLLGAVGAGVDIIKGLGVALEARLRDGDARYGVGVTLHF